ncbi:MAG: hypothetical protein IKZ64_01555, partial [Alphaproteobacteria bacterium]|nr:hypothetical protein [Alphaproteobacteria bacterium]
MATLTLGKSVTLDAVQSKKGDSVFVERRRRVIAPGRNELREEPAKPAQPHNPADDKLRAVLEAARAREEERKKREAGEAAARAAREAEIARETMEYEQVKEQLAARENAAQQVQEEYVEPTAVPRSVQNGGKKNQNRHMDDNENDDAPVQQRRNNKFGGGKKEFTKTGKISLQDIVMGGDDDDDDEIGIRGANRRRSEASLKRFREKARAMFNAPQKVAHEVTLGDTIVVKDLAAAMAEKVGNVV